MRGHAWTGRATARLVTFISLVVLVILLAIAACSPDKPPPDPPVVVPPANNAPVAYEPFAPAPSFTVGSSIVYDLRYRERGCNTAGDVWITGARDPDGDLLEYRITCQWSVFNEAQEKINDQWVTFPLDDKREQKALVKLWIGWTGERPKVAMGPMGCTPDPPAATFTYEVRDGKGGEAKCEVILGG